MSEISVKAKTDKTLAKSLPKKPMTIIKAKPQIKPEIKQEMTDEDSDDTEIRCDMMANNDSNSSVNIGGFNIDTNTIIIPHNLLGNPSEFQLFYLLLFVCFRHKYLRFKSQILINKLLNSITN